MVKVVRTIHCNICNALYGEVDTKAKARKAMQDAGWRQYLNYDVCPSCRTEYNFPGLTHPKAMDLLEELTRKEVLA